MLNFAHFGRIGLQAGTLVTARAALHLCSLFGVFAGHCTYLYEVAQGICPEATPDLALAATKESPMTRTPLFLALVLVSAALLGCGPDRAPTPVGRYRLDRGHFMEKVAGHKKGSPRNHLFKAAQTGLTLVIGADGTWLLHEEGERPEGPRDEGTWRVEGKDFILDYTLERGLPNVRRVRGTFIEGVIEFKPMPDLLAPLRFVPPGYRGS